ncbi:unnamed protein product [Spodoptera exigua]|nr:unnamed protein product [Spodoptera exigua]
MFVSDYGQTTLARYLCSPSTDTSLRWPKNNAQSVTYCGGWRCEEDRSLTCSASFFAKSVLQKEKTAYQILSLCTMASAGSESGNRSFRVRGRGPQRPPYFTLALAKPAPVLWWSIGSLRRARRSTRRTLGPGIGRLAQNPNVQQSNNKLQSTQSATYKRTRK